MHKYFNSQFHNTNQYLLLTHSIDTNPNMMLSQLCNQGNNSSATPIATIIIATCSANSNDAIPSPTPPPATSVATPTTTTTTTTTTTAPDEATTTRPRLETYLSLLIHSVKCEDSLHCSFAKCAQFRKILDHSRQCQQKRTSAKCDYCRQLFALCIYHAKMCTDEARCQIPFCASIKEKIGLLVRSKEAIVSRLDLLKSTPDALAADPDSSTKRQALVQRLALINSKRQSTPAMPHATPTPAPARHLIIDRKLRLELVKFIFQLCTASPSATTTTALPSTTATTTPTAKASSDPNYAYLVVYLFRQESVLFGTIDESDDYLSSMAELAYRAHTLLQAKRTSRSQTESVAKRKEEFDDQHNNATRDGDERANVKKLKQEQM